MRYGRTVRGTFVSRPNRFVAQVEVDGSIETVHVKNTGRCREILVPGATVVLEDSGNPGRKTRYDLIAAYKGGNLINIDSQAPNRAFMEFIPHSGLFGDGPMVLPEHVHGDSRFDFSGESGDRRAVVEVKGVTLEIDGVCMFVPDYAIHEEFGHELERAEALGVRILVYDCFVTEDSMTVDSPLPHRFVHS